MNIVKIIEKTKLNFILIFFVGINCSFSQNLVDEIFNGNKTKYSLTKEHNEITLFEYKIENKISVFYGLELYYVKIPLDNANIKININEEEKKDLLRDIELTNTIAKISGGFWKYSNDSLKTPAPEGLVISRGEIRNKKANWISGGVIFQNKDSIVIKHISEFSYGKINEAIQSKPIVVKNGISDIYSDDKIHANRICIGITSSNELLLCGVFNKKGRGISMYEFSKILIHNKHPENPNTKIALAMDGGPSAVMYFPTIEKLIGFELNNYIPNLIEIELNE